MAFKMENRKRILFEDLLKGREKLTATDPGDYQAVRECWDRAAKPLDSMGKFEDITARIGAIQRTRKIRIEKRAIIAMCADNGVIAEGVSQSGKEVTLAVTKAMGRLQSSVGKMSGPCRVDIRPIDIGIDTEEQIPGVTCRKLAMGTRNFAKEPAMTEQEVYAAVQVGMDAVAEAKEDGYDLLGCGEMGIGNTTTSCALACALLKESARNLAGRGAGLSTEGLERKIRVIQDALDRYELYQADPLTVLKCVGGLDLAGLVGVMIGGAAYGVPIVLDGVITAAAALCAVRMFPEVRDYLIASHISKEPTARMVLQELELEAVIHGNLALGEGTGAAMLFPLLDAALALYETPTTFADMEIEAYTRWK